ncbi:MAG TPA: DUF1489 domain-containing protein [Novosphingobium sp.]|nr:DUF1489 domain-containing protein [Novosphingobium sp.]
MPLNMTKIAYGTKSLAALRRWLESQPDEAHMSTRYLPKRHEEMVGGSLYWIMEHAVVGRSPIIGFVQRPDSRWTIRLEPRLVLVHTMPRRAHQGWRYLDETDAPRDLAIQDGDEALPPRLVGELAKLGLA